MSSETNTISLTAYLNHGYQPKVSQVIITNVSCHLNVSILYAEVLTTDSVTQFDKVVGLDLLT